MRRLIVYWVMTAIAMAVAMSAANAHAAPSDVPGFTRYVAERLHRSVPGVGVVVKADLALEATRLDGARSVVVSLARLYDFCERRRASCDDAVEEFLVSARDVMRESARRRERDRKPSSSSAGHAT